VGPRLAHEIPDCDPAEVMSDPSSWMPGSELTLGFSQYARRTRPRHTLPQELDLKASSGDSGSIHGDIVSDRTCIAGRPAFV
jgi:hypothetical protein